MDKNGFYWENENTKCQQEEACGPPPVSLPAPPCPCTWARAVEHSMELRCMQGLGIKNHWGFVSFVNPTLRSSSLESAVKVLNGRW